MAMPKCANHPERPGTYRVKVNGVWADYCVTCRLEQIGDDEEDEG